MAVTFNPLISKSGFKSEGFEVTSTGNVIAQNIFGQDVTAQNVTASIIDAASIKLNGITLFGESDSAASVFQITNQDFIVSEGSTPYLSVINGRVVISSRLDSVGKIDNVDIGTTTPALGMFTSIDTPVIRDDSAISVYISSSNIGQITGAGIDIPVIDTTIDNTVIGSTTPSTGAFTSVTIDNQPSSPASATRKDYVDTQISAFSIAFGI